MGGSDSSGGEYVAILNPAFVDCSHDSHFLVLYNAGVDPYPTVSFDALAERDQMVFEHVREWGIPCVWTLAGGYSPPFTDEMLAFAHYNTYRAAIGEQSVAGSEVVLLSED